MTEKPQTTRWPEQCDWPQDKDFTFFDEPGEHDPCYLIDPSGNMHSFNAHAGEGVDIARAKFIMERLNSSNDRARNLLEFIRIMCTRRFQGEDYPGPYGEVRLGVDATNHLRDILARVEEVQKLV